MKILFHTPTLSYRGMTVATALYAKFNQEILGNQSLIGYNCEHAYVPNGGTEPVVLNSFQQEFTVVDCTSTNLNQIVDAHHIDRFYSLRAGLLDPLPNNCITGVHAVFGVCEPHGNQYAYVSEWLSQHVAAIWGQQFTWVPHIVHMPPANNTLHESLNIPRNATVIGRHGGWDEFDVEWVKQTLANVLQYRKDYYLLFVNTRPWIQHERVIFLDIIHDMQQKSNFIATCDAMIHARHQGESFGLAIAEFLFHNKPVLAWHGGVDRNHVHMMRHSPLLYTDSKDLELKLNNFSLYQQPWHELVADFSPQTVMHRFKEVFLS
jgi:hypothetical protein